VNNLNILLDNITDKIASFLHTYSIRDVYKTTIFSIIYARLMKIGRSEEYYGNLRQIVEELPYILIAFAKRELYLPMLNLLDEIDRLVYNKFKPVIVEGSANIDYIAQWLKMEVGEVDTLLMYDCLSIPELLTLASYFKFRNMKTFFPSRPFINPIGLTRFMTAQITEKSYMSILYDVARYLANTLNAKNFVKNSYVDKIVHSYGEMGVDIFVNKINIEGLLNDMLSMRGDIIIMADHGYDVVESTNDNFLYIVHGYTKPYVRTNVIVNFSKIALFLFAEIQ